LQQCVNLGELKAYLIDDEGRRKFFSGEQKKDQPLSKYKLTLKGKDKGREIETDLRNEVANRIYDIRCKIVHTKDVGEDSERTALLPFSTSAKSLKEDIYLMRYISQKVLIASSESLRGI